MAPAYNSARLTLQLYSVTGVNPFFTLSRIWVDIKTPAFGTSPLLQITDFNAATSRNNVASFNSRGYLGSYSTYLSSDAFPYINKTGLTQLRLRFWVDDDNDFIADYLRFYSGNYAVVSSRPMLAIWYTP